MAQLIADRRDIDFVLHEQLDLEPLLKSDKFKDLNRKMLDMIINEARTFGIKEILPTFAQGDREGARFENGQVKVPECYHRAFKLFVQGEWTAMTADPEIGGQGLPLVLAEAASQYLVGANTAFCFYGLYTGL